MAGGGGQKSRGRFGGPTGSVFAFSAWRALSPWHLPLQSQCHYLRDDARIARLASVVARAQAAIVPSRHAVPQHRPGSSITATWNGGRRDRLKPAVVVAIDPPPSAVGHQVARSPLTSTGPKC